MDSYDPYNTLTIDFDKTRYKGAVVKCRLDLPFEQTERLRLELFPSEAEISAEKQFRAFGREVLIEWNLVDAEKKSIPANEDGVLLAPPALLRFAINTWAMSIYDVAAPLDGGSTPG